MFTVAKLGTSSTANVRNWRDGAMRKRWAATGMLEAERSFRRIKGHADLPALAAKVRAQINRQTRSVTSPEHANTAA
jgi:putative transposase